MVAEPDGIVVGTLDEDFAVESNAGDIMLLGNTSWRIRRVEGKSGRVLVEDAHGAPPSVPFWRGEAPARTQELSAHVAGLRKEISDRLRDTSPIGISPSQPAVAETIAWLKEECGLDDSGAEQSVEYILQGRAVLGDVPTQDTIIAERFFDEGGGMQLIIHAPYGGRINKAWGLALRKRFCRSFNFELQAAATDNGLNIALAEQHSFPLADVFHFLNAETVQPILEQAALASPILWHALALGRQSRSGPAALSGRQESSAADSAHALRRSAGVGVPRCGRLPGKHCGRHSDSRSSPGQGSDERCPHRGHGCRRAAGRC